jgi:hypothetical protein
MKSDDRIRDLAQVSYRHHPAQPRHVIIDPYLVRRSATHTMPACLVTVLALLDFLDPPYEI